MWYRRGLEPIVYLVCLLALAQETSGSSIIIGLQSQGIYLQEFWQDGKPYYLISNQTDSVSTLSVRWYSLRDDGVRFHDPQFGPVAGEWSIGPGEIITTEAFVPDSARRIDVRMDGRPIGILIPMIDSPEQSSDTSVVTSSSMNYWGGGPSGSIWFEQPALAVTSATEAELTMFLKAGAGTVIFGEQETLLRHLNPDREVKVKDDPFPLPQIVPHKATSATADIIAKDGLLTISAGFDPSSMIVHEVKLFIQIPSVESQSALILSGFRKQSGSSGWVTRLLVVEP